MSLPDALPQSHIPTQKQVLKAIQPPVSVLKGHSAVPRIVDREDTTCLDPMLHIHLKTQRNVVPVPVHWKHNRVYLKNKRGREKILYKLPKYIAATKIHQMRPVEDDPNQLVNSEGKTSTAPKINRIVMDFQTSYDAFHKFQTKPNYITRHGELYYEGREQSINRISQDFVPGYLTPKLQKALGMPPGAAPPFLINMQRFGPPPSYPDISIPGLNAPLPPGTQWAKNGWGKCPTNLQGLPLYGDVFGNGIWVGSDRPDIQSIVQKQPKPLFGTTAPQTPTFQSDISETNIAINRALQFRDPVSWTLYEWGRMKPFLDNSSLSSSSDDDDDESDDSE